MNIGGIGNTGIDYTRLAARQVEQQQTQQESEEEQLLAAQSVEQTGGANSGANTGTYTAQEAQVSQVAAASQQVAQSLTTSESEDTNTALINKANSGAELTASELSQLKELDSALYARAVNAQKAREAAREQMQANPSVAADAAGKAISRAVEEGDELAQRAIADEYQAFASRYDQADFSAHVFR